MIIAKNIQDWEEDRLEDNPTVLDRLTRLEQRCSYCKPNRSENASGKRREKPDKYKNKDRSTIRKEVVEKELE